tara:strand:- start:3992 stop:4831 length:840 start_codon:yes stop_codon:yes gene_type:complete
VSVELSFDKLIFGGSIESLLYSFVTGIPVIISTPIIPFELETIQYDGDFKFLGYENVREIYKSEMWDRLSFILSMAGLIMMPNIIKNIRQEDKKLIFATEGNTRTIINYNKIISFDSFNEEILHVYDWFNIKSGSKISLEKISDSDDFVRDIYFYRSKRSGVNSNLRDLVSYSKIQKNKIYDYEKSESFCRLKTIEMMKTNKLRGKPNGYDKNGNALFYSIRLEHTHRDIIKDYKPLYDFDQILKKSKNKGETWSLARKLLRHRQISILRESSRLQVKV